jgi:NADPH:quinone reductase-like Zn-dependent oxidoreductase
VIETGAGVDEAWRGRHVIIDPSSDWGADESAQGPSFRLLGLPADGTYAELVKVPVEQLHAKPPQLSFEEAAALPLATVTAYRALVTRGQIRRGEIVVVTGIGGGVATAALRIALHLGAQVWVTSGADDKLDAAAAHGAAGGVNHRSADWPAALIARIGERPDIVIDGAGGDTFNKSLDLLKPGGRLVSYGATTGAAPQVEVRRIFWKQLNVLGSTMGTRDDFAAMVALVHDGLRPIVDRVLPLADAAGAHRRMEQGEQFGKIVLKI